MTTPHDQAQRDRFVEELKRNFSVVASAGSGKTRAITERIVRLARHDKAADWLPSLVVVTYTNRAAAEMQQRARQSILEAGVKLEVLNAFNRSFFGTIHSLCLKLLRAHGHYIGLPGRLEHLDESDDAALWAEFVQTIDAVGTTLAPDERQALLRLVPAARLLDLGRTMGATGQAAVAPGPFPAFDFSEVYALVPSDKRSRASVARHQDALRRWEEAWAGSGFAGSPPKCESAPLRPAWEKAMGPIVSWRQRAALSVATEIARNYQAFRLQRGVMTFGDQVALAAELLREPEAARRIRGKNYRVILDEAQDTDPTQFEVLLEMSRPVEASGSWPKAPAHPPRPGHFCMVGDFQQSIYGARADLGQYRRIHEGLTQSGAGEEVIFSVTFRLDEAGVQFANRVFPIILHGQDRQVDFVHLQPRPTVLPGQIVRFDPAPQEEDIVDRNNWQKMYWEANRLAQWLRHIGLEKLRASSWSEVAVLCPRTRWLAPIRSALRAVGLKAQVQSERAIKGDSPAYAWFTALVTVLAEPRNGYEIAGVLREVFGLSDHDLAVFSEGEGDHFQIEFHTARTGVVPQTLNLLCELRERTRARPLFSALEEMVQATHLRERLQALPAEDFENLELELEELLSEAAAAEAGLATWEAFAADLQAGFFSGRDVRRARPDAVQIISGYKAKGSEWDAIVVPYFARGVSMGRSNYPRLLRDPRTATLAAAFDGNDIDGELKAAIDRQDEQELERLLYVALTRARHTLIVVDDRKLFAGKKGLQAKAQARLLKCGGGEDNAGHFENLPTVPTACAKTARSHEERQTRRASNPVAALPAVPGETLARARQRAAVFLKRNPSALAEAALAETDPAAAIEYANRGPELPNAGQRYGTWWHEFVETLRWSAAVKEWDGSFATSVAHSPDPQRSRREWERLRAQLTNGSALAKLLAAPGSVAHAEMPFLWALSGQECLDGIIDLAVHDPATGAWVILDWKTNRASADELAGLREHYRPQLSAYWKAAREMLQAPVVAGLYATGEGRWLPYSEAELAGTWEKLKGNPADLARVMEEERGD